MSEPAYDPSATLDVSLSSEGEVLRAQFEAAWLNALKGGPEPSIEEFLKQARSNKDILALRAVLLKLDSEFRQRTLLHESTEVVANTSSDCVPQPAKPPVANVGQTIELGTAAQTLSPDKPVKPALPKKPASFDPGATLDPSEASARDLENTDFSMSGSRTSLFGEQGSKSGQKKGTDSGWTDVSSDGNGHIEGQTKLPTVPGYDLLGELGRGGMGVVYKAQQKGLRRLVALKMVLSGVHASPLQLKRFRTEADAVARLVHPNIVQIYEVGDHDGTPYFSLEFVDGGPLDKQIGGKAQPPREAANLVETLARAMHFAHERNIIHRDLKPANVLMTSDGIPKITDFGLAKDMDEQESIQTKTGTIMGTPSYMSPEQAKGDVKGVGPLADQYTLGAILYELLTGRPPFIGPTPMDTVMQVIREEPVPPSRLQPEVPKDLETVCLKALQKETQKRYPSCFEFAEDLHRFLAAQEIQAKPISDIEKLWRWAKRNPKVAALLSTIGVLLIGVAVGSTYAAISINEKKKEADAAKELALKNEEIAREQADLALETVSSLIGDVQRKVGKEPGLRWLRREMLETALAGLNRVERNPGAEGRIERSMVTAYFKAGMIAFENQDTKDALQYFERAYDLAHTVLRNNPSEVFAKFQLADTCNWLGRLNQSLRSDAAKAREFYREALGLREQLASLTPEELARANERLKPDEKMHSYTNRLMLSEAFTREGMVRYFAGESAAAEPFVIKSMKIREGLINEIIASELGWNLQPTPLAWGAQLGIVASLEWQIDRASKQRQHLARNYHLLGLIYYRLLDLDNARLYHQKCLEVREWAMALDAKDFALKGDTGQLLESYGNVLLRSSDPDGALRAYDKAIALDREVIAKDKNLEILGNLSDVLYSRGAALVQLNRSSEAAPFFQECLAIREDLARKDPGSRKRDTDLMLILARNGKHEKAAALAVKLTSGAEKNRMALLDLARAYAQCSTQAPASSDLRKKYEDSALNALENAAKNGLREVVFFEMPDLDPIRDKAQFKALQEEAKKSSEVVVTTTP